MIYGLVFSYDDFSWSGVLVLILEMVCGIWSLCPKFYIEVTPEVVNCFDI